MRSYFLICALWLIAFAACKNSEPDNRTLVTEELVLDGRWELLEAKRNNRPTTTLSDLYFDFGPDGRLLTNLGGNESSAGFVYDGGATIQIQDHPQLEDFMVAQHMHDSLLLTTTIMGQPFEFLLGRPHGH